MNTKHTPGPWKHIRQRDTDDSHDVIATTGPQGTPVATCGCQSCDDGELAANARLIAAAPELLESLKSYLRAPSVGSDGPGSATIVIQEFNRKAARAAIAKAEGEQA